MTRLHGVGIDQRLCAFTLSGKLWKLCRPRRPSGIECPISHGAEYLGRRRLIEQEAIIESSNFVLLVRWKAAVLMRTILREALMILGVERFVL